MKQQLYYFSRNYVEFGTFTAEEITDFKKRGVLTDHDYVRTAEAHHWEPVGEWMANGAGTKPVKAKTATPRKKAASPTKASKKAA